MSTALAEQNGAQNKPRRVTNRHLPRETALQPVDEFDSESIPDAAPQETYAEEYSYNDEYGSIDSEVVVAGCKNCSSGHVSTQAYESDAGYEELPIESGELYEPAHTTARRSMRGRSFNQSVALGCDDGACCNQATDGCYRIPINPCSPIGLLMTRLSIRAEHGFFWGSGQQLPVLVRNNTTSLFGGGEVGAASVSGVRADINLWLDNNRSRAIAVRMFYGGENDLGLTADSTQFANINLPFISVATNVPTPNSALVSDLPNLTGGVIANLSSNVYGGDLLFKRMISCDHLGRWDYLMGYQTARLSESLVIESTRSTVPPGTSNTVRDSFQIKNQFHGATFGLSGDVREGNWYFGGLFKLGLGNMERVVEIQGSQTNTVLPSPPNVPSTTDSGLYASARSNSGRYAFDTFVLTPELNLTAGYRLTQNLDFTIGYNMLRLPKVTRVTGALDPGLRVDDGAVPSRLNPEFVFAESNFTLHSLNLGLQWDY